MARPQKKGLEYFPLDVDIDSDEKVDYVLARHGFEAFGILVKILMEIYRQGYYMMWTERQQYLLSKRVNVDVMYAKTVVSAYINEGFFSRNLYEKYEILTSHGIQTRYLQAVGRRSVVQIAEEFSLLDPSELPKNAKIVKIGVSVCENYSYCQHNVDNNGVSNSNMSAETPQSKVKNNNVVVVTRARARDIEEGNTSEVFTAFSNNIHPLTGEIEADTLGDLLDHYGKEWVLEAIKEAAKNHGTSVKYIEAILQAWERNGFKAPKKGRGNRNGRYIQGNSGADREEPEGLRKLKEDMAYADAHTVHPWDVQPDRGGDGEEPGKDSGGRGRTGAM